MTGPELRQILIRSGITQSAFAARLGKSARTIRRWIKDPKPVPRYAAEEARRNDKGPL
jgi:transcriptional regulator with XRE-family HTH domain